MLKIIGICLIIAAIWFITGGSASAGINVNGNAMNLTMGIRLITGIVGGVLVVFG